MIPGRFLFREVVRNILSFPARSAVVSVSAAVVGALVVALPLLEIEQIVDYFDTQQIRGIDTISVTSASGTGLSAGECDSAQTIIGVSSAGGILQSARKVPAQTPNASINIHSVTPGYMAVMFPKEPSLWAAGVVAASQVSDELGLVPDRILSFANGGQVGAQPGDLTIEGVSQEVGRVDGLNRDIFVASSPFGSLAECTVVARPGASALIMQSLQGWFSIPDSRIQPIISEGQLEIDPESLLEQRWSQWLWIAGGAALMALVSLMWWSRRDEVALYSLLGFSRGSVVRIVCLDILLTVVGPAHLGAALAATLIYPDSSSLAVDLTVLDLVRFDAAMLLSCSLAIRVSRSRQPVEALKGR